MIRSLERLRGPALAGLALAALVCACDESPHRSGRPLDDINRDLTAFESKLGSDAGLCLDYIDLCELAVSVCLEAGAAHQALCSSIKGRCEQNTGKYCSKVDGGSPPAPPGGGGAPPAASPDSGPPPAPAPAPDSGAPDPDAAPAPPTTVAARHRPFDPQHPIYQPIPANCKLASYSSQVINYIIKGGHDKLHFDTSGETPPIYVGLASDPTWTLHIHGKAFKVHAPSGIKAGTGSDYPLIILDESSSAYGNNPVEYRLWQASINTSSKNVTCNGGGVGVYANDGRTHGYGKGGRALGQAEIYGQNTGSGNSYTVGMIRPVDITEGKIPHAIRVAAGYIGGTYIWPATKTDQGGSVPPRAPMGARIFLDHSVNLAAIESKLASRLSNPLNLKLAKLFVKALQEYGMMMSDGTGQGHNVYLEHENTADWVPVIGPVNSYGSYNDVARAVEKEIPWGKLRVAHPDVFKSYGK